MERRQIHGSQGGPQARLVHLRSTVLSRSSTGGAFSAFKGTCEILDRVAVALGKDVAKWVSQPTGAPQGDEPVAAIPPQEDAK